MVLSWAKRQQLTFSSGSVVNSSAGEWVWAKSRSRSWNTSRLQMFPMAVHWQWGQDRSPPVQCCFSPIAIESHTCASLPALEPAAHLTTPTSCASPSSTTSKQTQWPHSIKLEPTERQVQTVPEVGRRSRRAIWIYKMKKNKYEVVLLTLIRQWQWQLGHTPLVYNTSWKLNTLSPHLSLVMRRLVHILHFFKVFVS